MKRVLLSLLLASILLTFSTFVGMSVFGMNDTMMHTDSDSCMSVTCATNCLDHCLSAASSVTTFVTPLPITFVILLVVVALAFSDRLPTAASFEPSFRKWREGIGKLLLQQRLSTVILRD